MKGIHRKLAVLLVLMLLVSVCACASAPDEPSAPASQEDPGVEISSREEETPAFPDTLPEDTTELKVPLQVVGPGTEDVFQPGEYSYSTQEDVDVCRQWLYDLRAEDITAMYGEVSPLDYYWTGEMSLEDSRQVVDLLRSVAPNLAPLETGNPYTGGGWTIALYTGNEAVNFGFNGGWFTFTYQGTRWIFDGETMPVQENCNDIEGILSSYSPNDVAAAKRSFSDDIQAIYAIDRENYVMVEVKDGYSNSKWIWDELQKRVPSDGEPSGYGFLIITDEGKEYVYMDTEEVALNKYCLAALGGGPFHPSWLIHMTPERIEKVSMSGASTTTDRDELLAVAKFLREEVTVRPTAAIYDGFVNPDMVAGLYDWRITFDSGVEYTLMGYASEGSLTVYTSDLNKHVSYDLDEGVDWKFIEFEGRDWP